MFRRHEVDVVAAAVLQVHHQERQALRRCLGPIHFLADVEVLAENAPEVAHGKENRATAPGSLEAVFLAKMRKVAGNDGMTPGFAERGLIRQPVHIAIARAHPAPVERAHRLPGALVQLAGAKELHVRRLKISRCHGSLYPLGFGGSLFESLPWNSLVA